MAKIELPEAASLLDFPVTELPENWNVPQYLNFHTQRIGASFVADRMHYALKIPSAVVPGEFNILLNPFHPAHQKTNIIEIIDPFLYDRRIVNQLGK
jgi:RES domain-containing protein